MRLPSVLPSLLFLLVFSTRLFAQPTTCPAPAPGDSACFQTSRPNNGNPLLNHPPIPHQDCCNAIPLCLSLNVVSNGVIVPVGAPSGFLYPGCVNNELPNDANTCFSNNEKGTTWYKFRIQPLPGGPTAPGSPAGKLRFKIIPQDVLNLPNYNPFTDNGATGFGNTDFDFLLFQIPPTLGEDGSICTAIKQSPAFNVAGSLIKSCNWTGTRGPTGLFEPGTGSAAAQGPAIRFNKPLPVKVGELYYLAVDNFSINIQGFQVDFRGLEAPDDSTAIVTIPNFPIYLKSITAVSCGSNQFRLTLTEPVLCDSVNPAKFRVTGSTPGLQIQSLVSLNNCAIDQSDTAFLVTLSASTPDSNLVITSTGIIKDGCGNQVQLDSLRFRMGPPTPNGITLSQTDSLLVAVTNGGSEFQWFLNGVPIQGAQQDSLVITQDGNYSVRARINGCLDSSAVQFFTDVREWVSGQDWRIYPNPANARLHLKGMGITEIRILNVMGKEVLQATRPGDQSEGSFSLESLETGFYWIGLSGNTRRKVLKLQVLR